jgi:glycosyltransferase involved in cell wall biosynthesis/ADP-heptose:LPS heptosyltransferase
MRILVISNLYPPLHQGGYELGCKDVVERLIGRGHDIRVLTSTYGCEKPCASDNIHRLLQLSFDRVPPMAFTIEKERVNQSAFLSLCDEFRPDVVFMWNLTHISVSLAELARARGVSAVYYISDNWLATWEIDHWYQLHRGTQPIHEELTPPPRELDLRYTILASEYLRDRVRLVGKQVNGSRVIHWGVDPAVFQSRSTLASLPARMLYVGQIVPHKGVHTAIEALSHLIHGDSTNRCQLTIVGDCELSPSYVYELRRQASLLGLIDRVHFTGRLSRDTLPQIYRSHDVLIFPSIWDEPFAITPLEAMATKMAVVATTTGGSSEIFEHGRNSMVFAPEDAAGCASQIARLSSEPGLFDSICHAARRTIEERFTMHRMVDGIEDALRDAAGSSTHHPTRSKASRRDRDATPVPTGRGVPKTPRFGPIVRPLVAAVLSSRIVQFFAGAKALQSHREGIAPRHVLILLIGDVPEIVFAGPALKALRMFWPGVHITLVVQPQYRELVETCPYVDEIHSFAWKTVPEWKRVTLGNLFHWARASWKATIGRHKKHPDVAVSLQWNADAAYVVSAFYMAMARARRRIAFRFAPNDRSPRQKLLDLLAPDGPTRGVPGHEVQRQAEMARFMGADPAAGELENWTTSDDKYVEELFLSLQFDDKRFLALLAPGSIWPGREWPVQKFVELGRWLTTEYDASIVIVGSDTSQTSSRLIERGLDGHAVSIGKPRWGQLAALLKRCGLVISGDSETLHLAAAAGAPLVGLFGSGEYQRFRPLSRQQTAIQLGLLCSPCYAECMFDRPHCINAIGVDQVKKAVTSVIQTRRKICPDVKR